VLSAFAVTIQSFLTGRRQRVVVAGHESTWQWILSGVPQGSVLGPILFLIYINYIVDQLNCNAYLFANDMKIFNAITTNTDRQELQSDINTIAQSTNKWQLKLNAETCKIMTVGRGLLEPPPEFLRSGKVRESQGILSESGKVRESHGKQSESGKSQGILKYHSLNQLFMHYFHNFSWLRLQTPTGALPQTL